MKKKWQVLSRPVSSKLCTIWDNTACVEISAPHNKCAALKWTNRSMRFVTQLRFRIKTKTLTPDAFLEYAWGLICVLGTYACAIVFVRLSIMYWAFSVSFHSQLACTALFLRSVRCAAQPNQRSEYWFPGPLQKKGGCCLRCNIKVLSRPNQHLLIIFCWPLPSGVHFFCSACLVWNVFSSAAAGAKTLPCYICLSHTNKLGINE